MKNKLMCNVSLPTHLGGCANSYLGLILTPTEYLAVNAIAYLCLVHPGALNTPPGATQHKSTRLIDEHK